MRTPLILLICLAFCACNTPKAIYDYDDRVDFSGYGSFDFYPELISGLSPLDEDRLLESLGKQLEKKGIVPSSAPDLFVNVYTQEYQEESGNRLGIGVGGGSGGIGMGVSGGIPLGGIDTYLNLTFDFIDASQDELVWQAVVNSKFNRNASPEERRAQFDRIVAKALEGYPPER